MVRNVYHRLLQTSVARFVRTATLPERKLLHSWQLQQPIAGREARTSKMPGLSCRQYMLHVVGNHIVVKMCDQEILHQCRCNHQLSVPPANKMQLKKYFDSIFKNDPIGWQLK